MQTAAAAWENIPPPSSFAILPVKKTVDAPITAGKNLMAKSESPRIDLDIFNSNIDKGG
jgi:hypothetical protein